MGLYYTILCGFYYEKLILIQFYGSYVEDLKLRGVRCVCGVWRAVVFWEGTIFARVGDGIARVGDGIARLSDGIPRIGDGIPWVSDGIPRIGDGIALVSDGIPLE